MGLINDRDLAKSQILVDRLTRIGRGVEDSVKVIAIWLWLECTLNLQITRKIYSGDDVFFGVVSDESAAFFSSVMRVSDEPIQPNLLKITLSLSKLFVPVSSVFSDRDLVAKGVSDIYTELCRFHNVEIPELSSGSKSKLDYRAKEWHPAINRAPEEERCLFLTFSNGYPLTEAQIIRFFARKYGQCVERVYIHWSQRGERNQQMPPLFGKVVFQSSLFPALILRGRNDVKFWVDFKPLWCKKFDSEKRKHRHGESL